MEKEHHGKLLAELEELRDDILRNGKNSYEKDMLLD
jgi:hypothetical protein